MQEIIARLALTEKFEKLNIQDISDLIYNEALRRGYSNIAEQINFAKGELISEAKIKKVQNNLSYSNKTTGQVAKVKEKGMRALGQELVDLALEAADTIV